MKLLVMSRLTDFKVVRLKKGFERRLRGGHPWVFSNELMESPKKIQPGEWLVCQDFRGQFIAQGYGNPQSLISFRALSYDPDATIREQHWWEGQAHRALALRLKLSLTKASFRWIYGEADGLPGLIVDAYCLEGDAWVLVVQAHTAGIDHILHSLILPALQKVFEEQFRVQSLGIVLRRDMAVRSLEGLELLHSEVYRSLDALKKDSQVIRTASIDSSSSAQAVKMRVDLIHGQKTGFFLDQAQNIEQVGRILLGYKYETAFKMLDICPYVGQWSAKIHQLLRAVQPKLRVEFTLLDASEPALKLAAENVGTGVISLKGDMMKELPGLAAASYDLVVCDPPALIKSKKDHPQGKQGYSKLFRESLRLVKSEGLIVCCSCSALLSEEDFEEALHKATLQSGRAVLWIAKGTQAYDHPTLSGVKEGHYLKMRVGFVR
jgi:23S rRNA (cytosine1962-C5)-methyltransferase